MKKLITLAVALVCVLTLSISAFASTAWDGGEWLSGENCYANPITGTAEGLNILSVELPSDHDILITFDKDLKDVDLSSLEVRYYIYTIHEDAVCRPFYMCANGGSDTVVYQPGFVTAIASVVDGKLAIDVLNLDAVIEFNDDTDSTIVSDFREMLVYNAGKSNDLTVGLRIKNPSGSGDFVGLIEGNDGTGLAKTVDDNGVCAFLPVSDFIDELPVIETDAPVTDAPTTDAPTTDDVATGDATTDAPATGDAVTGDAATTDAPTTDAPAQSGSSCGSVLSTGVLLISALLAAPALLAHKSKED